MRRMNLLVAAVTLFAITTLGWAATAGPSGGLLVSIGTVKYTTTSTADPDVYKLSNWRFQGLVSTSKTFIGVFHGTTATEGFDPRGNATISQFTIHGTGRNGTKLSGACYGGKNFVTMDPLTGDVGIVGHTFLHCSIKLDFRPAQDVNLMLDSGLYFDDPGLFPLPI
jgi:hypothetical protein